MAMTYDELLGRFAAWADERLGVDDGERNSDVGLLLDWRESYSGGPLDSYDVGDLDEFLLGWCPRKYSAPPQVARPLCINIGQFIEFLSAEGRLAGGAASAAVLIAHLGDIAPVVEGAMGDSANFGMAKSMFGDLDLSALADSPEALQALLDEQVAAHNALPFEERVAATERFFTPPPLELPFVYVPPDPAEVARSAAEAPILDQLLILRRYLAEREPKLTDHGYLKMADARALVDLLGTGDRVEGVRSSRDLPELARIVELALGARAIRRYQGRMVPVRDAWSRRTPQQQVEALWRHYYFDTVVDGPLIGEYWELLSAGLGHWLIPLIPEGSALPVSAIVERAAEVVAAEFGRGSEPLAEHLVRLVPGDVDRQLQHAETLGVLQRTLVDEDNPGRLMLLADHTVGEEVVALTPIGRELLADEAAELNYRLPRLPDLSAASGPELLAALSGTPGVDGPELMRRWRAEEPEEQRAAEFVQALQGATDAWDRVVGFGVLRTFEPKAAEPAVRQLLDSPAGQQAALYLLDTGLATPEQVDGFMGVGPMVDLLRVLLDEPDAFLEQWQQLAAQTDADRFLEDLWHHPAPESAEVLEALGRLVPDKRQAKAARKALIQHRSWLAARDH